MSKGSKSSGNSSSMAVMKNIGHISTVPVKTTVTIKEGKRGYQTKSRMISYVDKPEGSKSSGKSASKTSVATIGGYTSAVPVKTSILTVKGGKGDYGGEVSHQSKSRISYVDKQSSRFRQATTAEKETAGAFQLKNGTTGTKIECKKSSSTRYGDKNGYTEVYNEQRVRHVSYNKSSSSKNLNHIRF